MCRFSFLYVAQLAVLQNLNISRICPISESDIELNGPTHDEDLQPRAGLTDVVKRLHLGDKVYNTLCVI